MSGEVKFEKAIDQLESIVSQLESGDVSLEDAIKQYEEGVKLSRICTEKLTQAEKKVEILTKALNGKIETEDFDLEQDESTGALKKTRKKKSSKSDEDEGSLF